MIPHISRPLEATDQPATSTHTPVRSPFPPLLELRNVVKEYVTPAGIFPALHGINLHVQRGAFIAILGKSGSGKSTLLNMITGIDRPTSGEVFVAGTAIHRLSQEKLTIWRGRSLGIIFQSFELLPGLTVLQNVMLPMDASHTCSLATARARAMNLLAQVEIAEHAHKLPSAVSGGQQQRVAIARAMANNPLLLVADEPTGNLDSQTADGVIRLFEQLAAAGTTILMVTHDPELACRADDTIHLTDGMIEGSGDGVRGTGDGDIGADLEHPGHRDISLSPRLPASAVPFKGGPCQSPKIPWERGQPARPKAGEPPAFPGFLAETGDFDMTPREKGRSAIPLPQEEGDGVRALPEEKTATSTHTPQPPTPDPRPPTPDPRPPTPGTGPSPSLVQGTA